MLSTPAFSPDGAGSRTSAIRMRPSGRSESGSRSSLAVRPCRCCRRTTRGFRARRHGRPTASGLPTPNGKTTSGCWPRSAWAMVKGLSCCAATACRTRRPSGLRKATGSRGRRRPASAWSHRMAPPGEVPTDNQWLVHAWSPDGTAIVGVRENDDLRLEIVALDVRTGITRVRGDLGPSPPVNNPLRGFGVTRDGRSIITSVVRPRGDLWLLEGLNARVAASRWSVRTPAR